MEQKKRFRKGLQVLLLFFLLLGSGKMFCLSAEAAQGITLEQYWQKAWPFVEDGRFRTGAPYAGRSPYLSGYSCSGCFAYAADFCAYVYGQYSAWKSDYFTRYSGVSQIQSGDILHMPGHWFVVVERNGDELMTAEGNVDRYQTGNWLAECSRDHYRIENGQIKNLWKNCYVTIDEAYHYNFSPSQVNPGKTSVQVRAKNSSTPVAFSWSATANTQYYNLGVYNAATNACVLKKEGLTATSYSAVLGAGGYYVRVASVSGEKYTVSDAVSFRVAQTHTHKYQTKVTKATLSKNGLIQTVCSCGKVKPGSTKTTIYYPKTIKLAKTSYSYNGWTKTPKVTVTGSNGRAISSKYYSVQYPAGRKKAGTYTVKVVFKGNYRGTASRKFTISAKNHRHSYRTKVTKATTKKNGKIWKECACGTVTAKTVIYYPKSITLSDVTYVYDGKTKTPKVKVVGSNGKTISSKNYTVSYSAGRKKIGTYKVTVKFRGNYSGTATKTFKIAAKGWIYTDKLPSGVTSSKYVIQYKHTYNKKETYYENSGGVYGSLWPLAVSQTRLDAGYYYFHYCSGWKGAEVNYEQTSDFVHYDQVAPGAVDVVATGLDGSLTYYVLNWKGTSSRAYCQSGVTCDGSAGAHGTRGYAWYRMNLYQDRVLKTRTTKTQSGWVSKKDGKAAKVTYRYKRK